MNQTNSLLKTKKKDLAEKEQDVQLRTKSLTSVQQKKKRNGSQLKAGSLIVAANY